LFKPDERVAARACVESDCRKVGNQLFLLRDKPVPVNHMLLCAFERASHNLPVHSAKHNMGRVIPKRPPAAASREEVPRARQATDPSESVLAIAVNAASLMAMRIMSGRLAAMRHSVFF
jgi:hypothetical protein